MPILIYIYIYIHIHDFILLEYKDLSQENKLIHITLLLKVIKEQEARISVTSSHELGIYSKNTHLSLSWIYSYLLTYMLQKNGTEIGR